MQLTSVKARRDLAASMQRILAAAGHQPAARLAPVAAVRPARLPLNRAQITQSAAPLTTLAACLAAPGPVPAQGVAMVSQLLTDGSGPLYRQARGDDLGAIIATATRALSGNTPPTPRRRAGGQSTTIRPKRPRTRPGPRQCPEYRSRLCRDR